MIRLFDGRACSNPWRRILRAARKDGVGFVLNSGWRSNAKQAILRALFLAGRGPIAAKPGASTHNTTGWRQGADIGPDPAAVDRLMSWMFSKGLQVKRTVPSEYWHLNLMKEPSEGKLRFIEKSADHKGRYEASLRRRLRIAYAQKGPRGPALRRRIRTIKRRLRGLR